MKPLSILSVIALFVVFSSLNTVTAQNRGGWWSGGDSSIGLLQNEKIRKDLELVDDQVDELQTLRDEMFQEMRDMWKGMRDLSREERRERFEELRADMDVRRGEMEERIKGVLLPHQQKRLGQLSMQSQARRQGGTIGFVSSESFAEKLNLTDEQKAKLKETAKAAKEDLEKKISKLKEKAEQQVLSVLTKEQREQYTEMMGDTFTFEERSRWGNWNRNERRSSDSEQESDNRKRSSN